MLPRKVKVADRLFQEESELSLQRWLKQRTKKSGRKARDQGARQRLEDTPRGLQGDAWSVKKAEGRVNEKCQEEER